MFKLIALCFFCAINLNFAQNTCKSKITCSECIQELGCAWCIYPRSGSHCLHETEQFPEWCPAEFVNNPKSEARIILNSDFSSQEDNVIQIKPQKVKIKLRKGEEVNITFQYTQAKNYPIDLYYLMDLSASMDPHRDKLAQLGNKLAETMINITSNFRLGFGSFVDKTDLPFVSTVPEKLKNPCIVGGNIKCVPPYSYKNHLSLTSNHEFFSMQVRKSKVSGSLDSPEGGLDALMQAMVCKDEIKWRSQARHLLVFSTDAEFHIAGDGKLAGVIEPNDGQCHMKNNMYTHDLILDYPSVSHINHVAKQNNINLIFAIVEKNTVPYSYNLLSQRIENSNFGTLDEKSENVIKLVMDNYNKIVETVTITTNATSDIEVKFSSTCPNFTINGCTSNIVGKPINFTATIKLLKCNKDSTHKTIAIKPQAVNESIIVDLEMICGCDCESPSSEYHIPKSSDCSSIGTSKCGVCECDNDHFGKKCECNSTTSISTDETNCKMNENDTKVCSGSGVCKCGLCQCNERSNPNEKIFGKFCDCNNYSCRRIEGKLCSDRGVCECGGKCQCEAGWTGTACQCPDTLKHCIKPNDQNLVCHGQGICDCGKCKCFDDKVRYSGQYCDECPTCKGQRCQELRNCVECQAYKSGKFNETECKENCTAFKTNIVHKINNNEDENIKTCTLIDDKGCTFIFQYDVRRKHLEVKAQEDKYCPEPVNVAAWVAGVIVSILLGGLILLIIWKCLTTIHDRREYEKFERERQKLQWHRNENPLYKEATSTFSNPVFGN